jgi:hypothetical protein
VRKIIVRDANCFHHFENGLCSCRDYWWCQWCPHSPLDQHTSYSFHPDAKGVPVGNTLDFPIPITQF